MRSANRPPLFAILTFAILAVSCLSSPPSETALRDTRIVPLTHAACDDVAASMTLLVVDTRCSNVATWASAWEPESERVIGVESRFVADPLKNAVVVQARAEDMPCLIAMIERLDIRPAAPANEGVLVAVNLAALRRIWITANNANADGAEGEMCGFALPANWILNASVFASVELEQGSDDEPLPRMPVEKDGWKFRADWRDGGERVLVWSAGADPISFRRVIAWLEACGGTVVR